MSAFIEEVSDSGFEAQVLQSDRPVLVDFWAPWCGPCKAVSPIVDELAAAYGDRFKFAKCNVDDNPATPTRYGIKSIPTLLFFKDGKLVDQVIGMAPKARLEGTIRKILSGEDLAAPFPLG